jgi:hypothetical protein
MYITAYTEVELNTTVEAEVDVVQALDTLHSGDLAEVMEYCAALIVDAGAAESPADARLQGLSDSEIEAELARRGQSADLGEAFDALSPAAQAEFIAARLDALHGEPITLAEALVKARCGRHPGPTAQAIVDAVRLVLLAGGAQ